MGTIEFSDDMIKSAERLLDTKELTKTCKDYREALTIFNNYHNGIGYNKEQASALDVRLRKEYPEIMLLENTAKNLASLLPNIPNGAVGKYDEIINRLKFDAAGILAGVLLKKALIPDVGGIINIVSNVKKPL